MSSMKMITIKKKIYNKHKPNKTKKYHKIKKTKIINSKLYKASKLTKRKYKLI